MKLDLSKVKFDPAAKTFSMPTLYRLWVGGGQATGWQYLQFGGRYDWYYFNESGLMHTGWLDYNGSRYYLNPVSDGWKGAMFNGWHLIEGKWYYFEMVPGRDQGHMYVNTTTPDGYRCGADGAWDGRPAGSVG